MVGIELTEPAYDHEGFDPEHGVEEQLVRRAQADGKATAGLETLPEELGGLIALSREDQVRMLDADAGRAEGHQERDGRHRHGLARR